VNAVLVLVFVLDLQVILDVLVLEFLGGGSGEW
jgi:hypothetical protein